MQQQSHARSAEVFALRDKLRWHAENSELVDANHMRLRQQVCVAMLCERALDSFGRGIDPAQPSFVHCRQRICLQLYCC